MRNFTVLWIVILFTTVPVFAQAPSSREVESAIRTISKIITEKYVFPGKGREIAEHLLKEFRHGRFKNVGSWEALDSLATKVLRDFSGDGHLYVRNDPSKVRELSSIKDDTQADSGYDSFYYGEDAVKNNFGFKEVKVLNGNIGYIKLSEINISEKSLPVLIASMRFVTNTRALIIDVQDNGGGGSAIGEVFESYFLPKETPLLEFKNREGENHISKTVAWLLEPKYEKPLYIMTNRRTVSAAEAFAFALQSRNRAMIVGQRSAGAAHMNSWYPVNEHLYVSVSTGAPTLPGTEITWEQKGIQPEHLVEAGQEILFITSLIEAGGER
ncbi:MAG TPA: S41 family peptidase [Chryseolinea sp.]|nr:S41 family peptidase [Chryseolinea sp.]